MKSHSAAEWFDLAGDVLLFLSGLLLLIDIAPRDLTPSHKAQREAVAVLRKHRNLIGDLPSKVNVNSQAGTFSNDEKSVANLFDVIKQESDLAHTVDWSRAVGVGYTKISFPVAQHSLDVLHPLYVTLMPPGDSTVFELVHVGQLEDIDRWLSRWHQSSLTWAAVLTLTFGFFFQLLSRVLRWRKTGDPPRSTLTEPPVTQAPPAAVTSGS
jgi:hypothetical protein